MKILKAIKTQLQDQLLFLSCTTALGAAICGASVAGLILTPFIAPAIVLSRLEPDLPGNNTNPT